MHQCTDSAPTTADEDSVWKCPSCPSRYRFGRVGGVLRWHFVFTGGRRAA